MKKTEFILWLQRMGLNEDQSAEVAAKVDEIVIETRKELIRHVSATSDEFGMEPEESIERLCGLIQAVHNGDDPSTFDRFHAPPDRDSDFPGAVGDDV